MIKRGRNKLYHLLRWSEKYTKTDMLYLTKGGFWLTFGQVVVALAGLALATGFANLIPKEIYGNYKFILSIAAIIGAFTLTGMVTAITQSVARGFEGALKEGFKTQLKWSSFMVLIAFGVALYYFINGNNTLAIALLIVGAFSPLLISSTLYGAFLTGKKEFRTNTTYNILRTITPIAILLTTLFFTQNVLLLVFVYFLSNTATTLFFYLRTLEKYKPSHKVDQTSTNYSKHLSLMNLLSIAGNHADKILIFHYLGAVQLAIYAFALMIPTQLNGLIKNVSTLAFPKFSEQKREDVEKALYGKTIKIVIASLFITIAYIVVAPFLFSFLFPQYIDSIFYSQIFSLNIILTASALAIGTFFRSHKLLKESYITNIANNATRIVLMFILITRYEVLGIILAILISRFITTLLSFVLFKKIN